MTMMERTTYINRDNEVVYPPPYEQADTFLTAWVLPSPKAKQQAILDAALNRCSGGQPFEYRPLLSRALLVLANIGRVSSLDPKGSRLGWIPEVDICTWILCGAYKLDKGKRVLDHLAWYLPYIWVTTAHTMATGREVFGYPKAIGWAQLPENPDDPGPLWADGMVLPTYSPNSEVVQRRLFDLVRDPDVPGCTAPVTFGATQKLEAFTALARKLHEVGEADCDWHFFASMFENLLGGHVPMVFLKQFRDVTTPDAACYQAIVEANATVNGFSGGGFLRGGWNLEMYSYASVDMAGHLGLEPKQHVDLGFYAYFSFSMDFGKEVWRAGGAR
jgi:hypothetical protein